MAFSHLKKLLLVALFAGGILSSSAMASYLSDYVSGRSSGIFHPLSDATLDLSDLADFTQFSNRHIDEGRRITLRTPGKESGSQLIGGKPGLSANKSNPQGGIRVNGGKNKVAGRRALPVFISDKSRPINWEIFNLDGGGNVTISNRGDLSLLQPSVGVISGGRVALNGGSLTLREPAQLSSSIITISGSSAYLNVGSLTTLSSPVPLPAASILLGSGLLGLLSFGASKRRR